MQRGQIIFFAVVGLVVLLLAGISSTDETGTAAGIFWLVVLAGLVAVIAVSSVSGRRRREAFRQVAAQSGYRFEPKWKPVSNRSRFGEWLSSLFLRNAALPDVPEGLAKVPLFDAKRLGMRGAVSIVNVLNVPSSAPTTFLFDCSAQFYEASAHLFGALGIVISMFVHWGGVESRHTVAAFRFPQGDLPTFELRPRHWSVRGARLADFREIRSENAEVAKRYLLCGRDEVAVRRLFTPSLFQGLTARPPHGVEGAGPWVIVFRPSGLVKPGDLRTFLDEARTTAGMFGATAPAWGGASSV